MSRCTLPAHGNPDLTAAFPAATRLLRREWKPYLPKSSSLPAFQLVPRDRPRFTCLECGFVNFYNIPLCVWCATKGPESSVRAFESTMPRVRRASAPPRPNALRIGHPSRPYYSAIRKDTSYYSNSAARPSTRAPRPASIALPSHATSETNPIPLLDDDDEDHQSTFTFVSPEVDAVFDAASTPHRTLSARISRRLASPVAALHSMNRVAEKRGALAALVRPSQDHTDHGLAKKLRRGLRGLVRPLSRINSIQ
ncbi:hypothetical protein B0H11DRAFT_2216324 [Mycena galericulata]|nr:hypothetical protein B0H11DRAFT_2216324 [Mycena galericulata]